MAFYLLRIWQGAVAAHSTQSIARREIFLLSVLVNANQFAFVNCQLSRICPSRLTPITNFIESMCVVAPLQIYKCNISNFHCIVISGTWLTTRFDIRTIRAYVKQWPIQTQCMACIFQIHRLPFTKYTIEYVHALSIFTLFNFKRQRTTTTTPLQINRY